LDELFTQVLAALSKEGWMGLEQVMQDGTKIRAAASGRSFQQEDSIREHWERALRCVAEMGDPLQEECSPRSQTARQRAQQERTQRLENALQEFERLRQQKPTGGTQKKVSISDAQARFMKQPDGGLAPSYNLQISADAAHGLIVGLELTEQANDSAQLLPAIERIEQRLGKVPQQIVADGGYTTQEAIEQMAERGIEFFGNLGRSLAGSGVTGPQRLSLSAFQYVPESNRYRCPEGKWLRPDGRRRKAGAIYYRAAPNFF
jgi:hypothetical protein